MEGTNKRYVCPICSEDMEVYHLHDGVDFLKCTFCNSEVHFGSWEVQRAVVEDEDVSVKGKKLAHQMVCNAGE